MNMIPLFFRLPTWSPTKWYLLSANVLLILGLIILANTHVVPLDEVNFFFFLFVAFLFALYRPGWTFLFLVGLLPLEAITLVPPDWGMALRPYQLAGAVLALALLARLALGKLNLTLVRLFWFDALILLLPLGALLATLAAPDPALSIKQALVVASFVFLYFLFRQYLQTKEDIRQTLPFFLSSALVVFGYAVWQNIREKAGETAYTVMAGRPNATFTESDWLGMFVLFVLIVLWVVTLRQFEGRTRRELLGDPGAWLLFFFHVLVFLVLILTVSRSAWLGALGAALVGGVAILLSAGPAEEKHARFWLFAVILLKSFILALLLVVLFRLTPFELLDRAASTGTGLQKITVACQSGTPPERIETLEELAPLGCQHILLEEREERQVEGQTVGETLRPDPTIMERKGIYQAVGGVIRERWLWGIGWGSIGSMLGTDGRGATLNASNAWLEVWLGSGLLGALGFLAATLGLAIAAARILVDRKDELGFFVLTGAVGLGIFNVFNSGVLLGFFFLFLALGASLLQQQRPHNV